MRHAVGLAGMLVIFWFAPGCGSSDTGGDDTTTSTSSGTGGGTQGTNGCVDSMAEDHTAEQSVTITSTPSFTYTPKCIVIHTGTSVTFNSAFATHPLVGGTLEGGTKMPDASSPIKPQTTGTSATFMFPNTGTFGYYCNVHAISGMTGAIFVK